ncbi:MAG: hypothetical protein QNK04_14200 [Myxococcota bacterium]|nr:hypothetical protein [Myxococcota bacterium]
MAFEGYVVADSDLHVMEPPDSPTIRFWLTSAIGSFAKASTACGDLESPWGESVDLRSLAPSR